MEGKRRSEHWRRVRSIGLGHLGRHRQRGKKGPACDVKGNETWRGLGTGRRGERDSKIGRYLRYGGQMGEK